MKTLRVCVLVMVIPLIGGCTEQTDREQPWTVKKITPGPDGIPVIEYYIYDQTLNAIDQKLKKIQNDVKEALAAAGKKTPISGDQGIRLKLEEINMKLSDVRTALEVASRKIPISGDVVQIITYLRPKLNVEVDPNVLCSDKEIRMTFNITNRGEHSISIGGLQLTLSKGKDASTEESQPDIDYRDSGGVYVAPGKTIKRIADIEIKEAKFEGHTLYYSLCIDAETEPEIVEILSGLLLDSVERDKLYSISRASLMFTGEASLSAFSHPE